MPCVTVNAVDTAIQVVCSLFVRKLMNQLGAFWEVLNNFSFFSNLE